MKNIRKVTALLMLFIVAGATQFASAKELSETQKKAAEWVSSLELNDKAKEKQVIKVVAEHLTVVRTWHNEHPASTVPAGINPRTGGVLTDLDRQIIADSAMPASVHQNLMNGLRAELTEEQVELVLDKYTVGKVAFTMKAYREIVPNMTAEEDSTILGYLTEAREMAVDYKSMKQISAIFEIYKTKAEQYLNGNGRNWRKMYKDYVNELKKNKK